jgi:hypothetical protein
LPTTTLNPMSEEAWEKFLGHSRRVLARPTFDEGQRNWKIKLAGELRDLLGQISHPDRLQEGLAVVFPQSLGRYDHRHDLPAPRQANWLRRWLRLDPGAVERALSGFAHTDGDPVSRFARFAKEAAAAPAEARVNDPGIVAVGSFFNFSLAPESLPIMREGLFERLEEILGYGHATGAPVAKRYEHHLAFADEVKRRLDADGVPIRDMVDVQSLIYAGAYEHEFWAYEEPEEIRQERERARIARQGKPYLTVCAMYLNEAPYLREWIEFHRLVGVERFYLYDNGSEDDHREVLAPYVDDGTVVLYDWPFHPGQMQANDHCVTEHRYDARWIATLDIDEFLFSPLGVSVPELLTEFEEYPAVGLSAAMFGTNGHRTSPPELVIESHLLRARKPWPYLKNIVDPTRVVRCMQAHAFSYDFRTAVDENHEPIRTGRAQLCSISRLRFNHYYLKSEAEGRPKLDSPFEGTPRPYEYDELDRELSEVFDDSILQYLPALREAMSRTSSGART